MRALVTGATGLLGAAVCRELAARGVEVLSLSHQPASQHPSGVRVVPGDVGDRAAIVAALAQLGPSDPILHLSWRDGRSRGSAAANLAGMQNLLAAMETTGAGRLIFASSTMVYGATGSEYGLHTEQDPAQPSPRDRDAAQKLTAERLISESSVPALIVRIAPMLGRTVRNRVTDQLAGPAILTSAKSDALSQFVHHEDTTRFLADVSAQSNTGTVNLAADGYLTLSRVAELLDKPVLRLPTKLAAAVGTATPQHWPLADTTSLHNDFGFRCAWSNSDAVTDTRRSLITYMNIGPVATRRRSYVPFTEPGWRPDMSSAGDRELEAIGPAEYRGEFDDAVDPKMSTFTATNVGEAFPGPMTPLSLQIGLLSLRAGSEVAGRLVGLDGELAHETQARSMCSFGHRVYLNVSVIRGVFDRMPGSTPEQADAQYLGKPLPEGYKQPPPSWADAKVVGAVIRNGGLAMARIGLTERWLLEEAERLSGSPAALDTLTDAELDARIALLIDTFVDSQVVNGCVQAVGAAALSAAERRNSGVTAGSLASARALEGVHRVAELVRTDPVAAGALEKYRHEPDALRHFADASPALHSALQQVLAEVGHRGPGEFELANATFADRPVLLFDAIYQSARGERQTPPEQPQQARRTALEKIAGGALQRRERVRDASIRIFHQLRLALREKGERLVGEGLLPDRDAVFFLTIDELSHPPADTADVVGRRREEREKLKKIEPPSLIEGAWQPVTVEAGQSSSSLSGAGVSRGVVTGRVRVLSDPDDGVEPGEVLVCRVTDIGWTPLFASSAAVVSEIGGAMSHTAVVAREFGIPAVVGVELATHHLRTGQLVEVDGTNGTVTVLPDDESADSSDGPKVEVSQ